jgi:hypothetical protein
MRNADAKSVSTTSSRKSRARAKLEAILARVKLAEEEAALYKRKAIIRQQTDEEQIDADLNVLRIKREAVDAEVEVKVADEDAKNVPHDLNIPVDKNRTERYITEHFGQTKHYVHNLMRMFPLFLTLQYRFSSHLEMTATWHLN